MPEIAAGPSGSARSEFLSQDFDQAFQEKRRLEDQAWDICKFAFGTHGTLIGMALAVYRYSIDNKTDFVPAAMAALGIGTVVGFFLLFLMIRVRVYFVAVCRFINSRRQAVLGDATKDQRYRNDYYRDPSQPTHFNWGSTQVWGMLLVAVLNAAAAGTLAFLATRFTDGRWVVAMLAVVVAVLIQFLALRAYLVGLDAAAADTRIE